MSRKQELEARYGNDDALGVQYIEESDESEGFSALPDGGSATLCTDYATYIVAEERKRFPDLNPQRTAEVFGWAFNEGAEATATVMGVGEGHDFAVIEERYIVDPWVVEIARTSKRAVFDLLDPEDWPELRRLYGNSTAWVAHEDGTSPEFPCPHNKELVHGG